MRIHVLSDLHIEFGPDHPAWTGIEAADADVIVLAGDIWLGTQGIEWAAEMAAARGNQVVYVAGNHEFYGHEMGELLEQMRATAVGTPVRFLENEAAVIDGVRFLGCTLWTDYEADPATPRAEAMREARWMLNDHARISVAHPARTGSRSRRRTFLPSDALRLHQRSRQWLTEELERPFDGPTVVVTHHAPSPAAQHPDFPVGPMTGAFQSDLDALIDETRMVAWIFGHTHHSLDTTVNGVRLVANQRGYGDEQAGIFDPKKVITIGSQEKE